MTDGLNNVSLAILVGCLGVLGILLIVAVLYCFRRRGWCCFQLGPRKTASSAGLVTGGRSTRSMLPTPGVNADPSYSAQLLGEGGASSLSAIGPTGLFTGHEREARLITASARRREQERSAAAAAGRLTGAGFGCVDEPYPITTLQPLALHCLRAETPSEWLLPAKDMGDLTRGHALQINSWKDSVVVFLRDSAALEPAVPDDEWYTPRRETTRDSSGPPDSRSERESVASSEPYLASLPQASPVVSNLSNRDAESTEGLLPPHQPRKRVQKKLVLDPPTEEPAGPAQMV